MFPLHQSPGGCRRPSLEARHLPSALLVRSIRTRTYVPLMARSQTDVRRVLSLVSDGLSDHEVARRTGVPRSTVQRWRDRGVPRTSLLGPLCERCGSGLHEFTKLPGPEYAYLLGQYLGDGTIYRVPRTYALRISGDAQYSGIIGECCEAIEAVKHRRPYVRYHPYKRLANIISYWKAWPCLFPQHGRGRKHHRTIALALWQVDIVETHPGRFLRGLIHSDGWRGLNRVRVKGRDYEYPRYQFSNRSADIRQLFVYACELVGVAWRPWGKWHISVARREAVEILDRYVGPKS
jgi:Homeodomain-like domain